MRVALLTVSIVLLTGCATTTTQLAPISREAVTAEEAVQRELVLVELAKAQERLNDIAYPLMAAAVPMCETKIGPRYGVTYRTIHEVEELWRPAARAALSLSDTLTLSAVTRGSAADLSGLKKGDRVLTLNGSPVPPGKNAVSFVQKAFESAAGGTVRFGVQRGGGLTEIAVAPDTVCNLGALVTVEGDINAYADGQNIVFPWAMMRFANDDELRAIVAHEIAHNGMGHIEARKKNMILGGLLGALADVALATQGVNTGGENTANFMEAAAAAFSQDFEREADYVGMYIMARAGVPLTNGPNLWRQFAQINPRAISYASTHPTTAERFVRLRAAIDEIERKRRQGEELLPERKQ